MTYEQMKKRVFAKIIKNDGYNGHKITIELAMYNGKIYEVSEYGYYRSELIDESEVKSGNEDL